MFKSMISDYVSKLKKEDVIKFIENNQYQVSNKEIDTIYFYIKNYSQELLDNKEETWNQLKNDISENTYLEIMKLVNKYKKFL